MLVNHHTAEQAEASGELAHPLLGSGATAPKAIMCSAMMLAPAEMPPTTVRKMALTLPSGSTRVVRLRTTLRTQRNDLTGAKRQEDTPIDLDHLGTQR
jgi:hypothetical protein